MNNSEKIQEIANSWLNGQKKQAFEQFTDLLNEQPMLEVSDITIELVKITDTYELVSVLNYFLEKTINQIKE